MPEAGRKLKQETAQFRSFGERSYSGFEFLHVVCPPFALAMAELLPGFDGEFEVGRCALCPAFRGFRVTWPVEGPVRFHRVERPRIDLQFVALKKGVKESCPGARPGTGRITPAARTNTEYSGI